MKTCELFELFKDNVRNAASAPTAGFDALKFKALLPDWKAKGQKTSDIQVLRVRGGVDVLWCSAPTLVVVVAGESEAACEAVSVSVRGGELSVMGRGSACVIGGGRVVIGDNRGVVISTDGVATISSTGGFASTGDINVYASHGSVAAGRRIRVNGVDVTDVVANAPSVGRAVVLVASPACPDVELEGSSDVILSGIDQKALAVCLSGSGTINADGRVEDLRVALLGSGDVRTKDLEAISVDCELKGSGDIYARAVQSIRSRLYGSGDIVVRGNPTQRDTRVQGSGDVRFVGP